MSNIFIDIAAEFTGKKAFKQAETSTEKLTKSVKHLGRTLGVAFSTAAVLRYAKTSVSAAANDIKAQQQLALALKNVGLGRDAASSESFIQRLQKEFGIVDDELRPAYQKLAIATRSSYESQKLLQLALDISASTGKDLGTVTSALSKAYLGSNTALSKLGVGISKADLKSKSFNDITKQLATTFAGAAKESADTFAGSIAKLGVASKNVSEIIGTGLIDALTTLSKDKSISNMADDMERLATSIADNIRGVAIFIDKLKHIPYLSDALNWEAKQIFGGFTNPFQDAGAKARRIAEYAKQKNPIQSGSYLNVPAKPKPTAAEIAAAAAAKKLLKTQQDALKLSKAQAMFNMQNIQIAAALKGKISEEDRARLKLMGAIEDKNIELIDNYTKALDAAQKKTKELQDILYTPKADPFASFTSGLSNVQLALEHLRESGNVSLGAQIVTPSAATQAPGTGSAGNGGISIVVNGAMDPVAVANQIQETLTSAANRVGKYINLGSGRKDQMYVL